MQEEADDGRYANGDVAKDETVNDEATPVAD